MKKQYYMMMALGCAVMMGGVSATTASAEEKNFSFKESTSLTKSIVLPDGHEVSHLVSVPVGQKFSLKDVADETSGVKVSVKNVTKSPETEEVPTENIPVEDGVTVDGKEITVEKEGLSVIAVSVNGEEKLFAVKGLAKSALSDNGWKISKDIDAIKMPDKLSDSKVYGVYERYFKAKSAAKKDKQYDKMSRIQYDGTDNQYLITNSEKLGEAKETLQKYLEKGAVTIKSVKEISEYEGLKLTWSHKLSKKDILAYDFQNDRNYSKNQKKITEYAYIYNKNGKKIRTAKCKVALKDNKNIISLTKAMKKNGTYHVVLKNGYGKKKSYRFKFIFKKLGKRVYVKSKTHVYSKTYQGKKVRTIGKYYNFYGTKKGSNGWVRVEYADGKYGYIKTKNITYKRILPARFVSKTDSKYSYNDMRKDLNKFKTYYSGILDVEKYGKSEDDRNLYYVRIGNPKAKKRVILQSSMHAREWLNTQMFMVILEDYARGYYSSKYSGKTYKQLFDHVCFYVIPCYNPDGMTISQYGPSAIRNKTLRARVRKIGNFRRWKANARGVDLNRNFNAGFKKGGHPSSEGYAGSKACSESETQAMIKLVEQVKTKTIINYHEVGGVIYYNRGSSLLSTIRRVTGYYLIAEHSGYDGSLGDWEQKKGMVHCTPETGTGPAPISHSQFWTNYRKNKNVILAVARMYY